MFHHDGLFHNITSNKSNLVFKVFSMWWNIKQGHNCICFSKFSNELIDNIHHVFIKENGEEIFTLE